MHYRDQRAQLFVHVLATAPGLTVRAGETLVVESFQQDLGAVVVERGGTLRFEGRSATIIADSIRIDGHLFLRAASIEVSGTIVADGAPGGAGYPGTGAGGGGAGGWVELDTSGGSLVISGNVSVRGGAGGGSADGDAGGGGGGGQLSVLAGGTVDVAGALLQVAGGPGGSATAGGFDGIAGGEGAVVLP